MGSEEKKGVWKMYAVQIEMKISTSVYLYSGVH
jgi:hypothetical protein